VYLNNFNAPVLNVLKGLHFADAAEIQGAVTDELKNFQKEEFSAVFRTTAQKPVYVPMELILN